MHPEIPSWKYDGKSHPPDMMRRCEPERYELQLLQFGDPEVVARYIGTRTLHDACRSALRSGERCIGGENR
jgi:hypothetical protein